MPLCAIIFAVKKQSLYHVIRYLLLTCNGREVWKKHIGRATLVKAKSRQAGIDTYLKARSCPLYVRLMSVWFRHYSVFHVKSSRQWLFRQSYLRLGGNNVVAFALCTHFLKWGIPAWTLWSRTNDRGRCALRPEYVWSRSWLRLSFYHARPGITSTL